VLRKIFGFLGGWLLRLGLPLAAAAAALSLFPVTVTAAGVTFDVQASLLHNTNLSADTTVGSWIFPSVDGLPIGLHVRPVDVDLVRLASVASADPARFARELRAGLAHQAPGIALRLGLEAAGGVVVGLLLAAAVNLAMRNLRGLPRRSGELGLRTRQSMAAALVLIVVADAGVATYDRTWTRDSRLTGTLAALQLFPRDLQGYYTQHSKALNALSAVAAIQSGLQRRIDARDEPPAAYRIMLISDMHLGGTYPLVEQYAENFHVQLIINTGDEAEFGTRAEMTPSYLAQLRAVAAHFPMIWLAGNHDSPATIRVMSSIPGVTVVGGKAKASDGQYQVTGGELDAFGLHIGAVPDPRVYGSGGPDGADLDSVVGPLEQKAIDTAVAGLPASDRFDIFATHEPVAATQALHDLPSRIRETVAGHVHAQNPDDQLQSGDGPITLVEGSTGAGGLDNLAARLPAPPLEFSIESVAKDCQFTKIVRFQIVGAAPSSAASITQSPPQVTASTHYFAPQPLPAGRTCSVSQGLSAPAPMPAAAGQP
jgi:hypothetical protein